LAFWHAGLQKDDEDEPEAPQLAIGYEVKRLAFSWSGAARATSYKFMQRAGSTSDFTQLGSDLPSTVTTRKIDIPVHLFNWASNVPQYRIDACNAGGCTSSNVVTPVRAASVLAEGYVKASDTAAGARLGSAVAVSGDGKTFAIGAPFTNGEVGSIYVYTAQTTGSAFTPHPVKISAPSAQAMRFGFALALSEDGNTLAVGAPYEGDDQSGVGTYPVTPNDNAPKSGAVFVYSRVGGLWSATPVYIKSSDADAGDEFGHAGDFDGLDVDSDSHVGELFD